MLWKFIKLPFRSLLRQGHQSLISALGLSIALSCGILILLYIRYERSFDRYHKNCDRIYRVMSKHSSEFSYMGKTKFVVTPGALRGAILNDVPEVERSCRCKLSRVTLGYNSSLFEESGFLYADYDLLEMFSFPVLSGNPAESLKEPFNLFITRSMASKYFGKEEPYGKTLTADNKQVYTVRGVLEDIPQNSHFDFDFLTGFETLYRIQGGQQKVERWPNFSYLTYVQLVKDAKPEDIIETLNGFILKYLSDTPMFKEMTWILQPLRKIHLGGTANFDPSGQSSVGYIYMIASVGIFILLIAAFNYMNMATARSYGRSREIGIIKVAGSSRNRLIFQLITESIILSFCGLLVAMLLVWFILPVFADFMERPLAFRMIFEQYMIVSIAALTIFIGVFSGIFPALRLSAYSPIRLIKEEFTESGCDRKSVLKNILVGFQYFITIVAIISSFTVFKQLRFIKTNDPGFTHESVLTISLKDPEIRKNPVFLINELGKNSKIVDVAASSNLPSNISSAGFGLWEGRPDELNATIFRVGVDTKFIDFYDLKVLSGRDFSHDFRDDSLNNYIINQTAARMLGIGDPVGLKFGFQDNMGFIIGVVRDFNFQSLDHQIEPLAISIMPNKEFRETQYLSVKVNPDDHSGIKTYIEEKLKELSPGYLNPVSFMNDSIDRQYTSDKRLASIILFSTVLTLLLSCLGQYSLSFYETQKRTREMAVRKVFGAQSMTIWTLLAGRVLRLILFAIIPSWPVSYLVMNKWLQHYAYRTEIDPALFIYSFLIVLFISLGVISYHITRLSWVNPAEAIRHD